MSVVAIEDLKVNGVDIGGGLLGLGQKAEHDDGGPEGGAGFARPAVFNAGRKLFPDVPVMVPDVAA